MKYEDICKEFIFENSSMIFLETDDNWKIIRSNKYADHLYGKRLENLDLKDFVVDFSGKINFDDFVGKKGVMKMLNVNTFSGLPQTFYFSFFKIENGIAVFGESNSKEVEELRKSFLELNNHLSNLTRELQKKNVQLFKLNEQKNEFIGMAAHDLRNPIGVIMGYSEFILDEAEGLLPKEHIKFLRVILSSSEFMLKMLNELLDISKIESGKLNLAREKLSLQRVISDNVSLNRVIADKKQITINVEIFEDLDDIFADPVKIEQVLNNLISNAIKFSHPGSAITVSAFSSKDHITVSVKDEGQGIPEQDIEKLFKPFPEISTKSTGGEKSTGLGLSITKKIIIGHGGKIWVESKVGKGTTFYFSLPCAEK